MTSLHFETAKGHQQQESGSSSERESPCGKVRAETAPMGLRILPQTSKSASPAPDHSATRELIIWRKHHINLILAAESEKDRIEKANFAREKRKLQHQEKRDYDESGELTNQRSEKLQNPTFKLSEIRRNWAKEQVEVASKADLTLRERETYRKMMMEQRIAAAEEKARVNRNRMEEVRECKSQIAQEEDDIQSETMREIQRKMDRSQQMHSAMIQSRVRSAAQRTKKGGSLSPWKPAREDDSSRVLRYVHKIRIGDMKKTEAKREELKEKETSRKLKEEKWKKVETNLKKERRKMETWTKSIEERQNSLASTVEYRLSEQHKNAAYRHELQRDREDQYQLNRQKLMYQYSNRKAEILYKWTESGKRIETMKQNRALSVERHRERMHSIMLEKEKTYQILQTLAKSPKSKRAQRMLKRIGDSD